MPTGPYRNASIVTARPIVPGPIAEYTPPDALSAGSQLDVTAYGGPYQAAEITSGSSLNKSIIGDPWPRLIDAATRLFNSWRPNFFREISTHNVAGNYGSITSTANYNFQSYEFPSLGIPTIGNYPGPVPSARRPEWNNLVSIIYGLRVLNPVGSLGPNQTILPQAVVSQFTVPTQFTPTGTASLSMKGEVLQ